MRIYFIRHGESFSNISRELSGREDQRGLTEKGWLQIQNLGMDLNKIPVARIYTSPLLRAVQSGEIFSKIFDVPAEASKALEECGVGELEGRRDDEAWEQYWQVRRDWASGKKASRIKGGESLLDLENRFVPFVRALARDASPMDEVLVVGHGGLFCALLPGLLQNVSNDFAESHGLSNAAYIVAEKKHDLLWCSKWEKTFFHNAQ